MPTQVFAPHKTRDEWTTWETKRANKQVTLDKATTTARDKKTNFDTASADFRTAKQNHDTKVQDLAKAKKDEIEAKKQARQGFGRGGRTGGKGGVAVGKARASKAGGKKGKKGKKKKDESLHRILGRDLINELDEIKTSIKIQRKIQK